jgi:hypothetical protein
MRCATSSIRSGYVVSGVIVFITFLSLSFFRLGMFYFWLGRLHSIEHFDLSLDCTHMVVG